MADAQDANNASEPSMEEILASIRRIISDEKEPAAAAASTDAPGPDDVLELTQMVQEDGSVVDIGSTAAADAPMETVKEPEMAQPQAEERKQPEFVPEVKEVKKEDSLVSDQAVSAATSSLAALASTVQIERLASMPVTPLGNAGRTLEDIVVELMRPILKEWLDKNLPALVDRHVQKEVERIARRIQD